MIKVPTAKQQTGFTLIEAMVALLIFSVGLLGLAGMQMSGMQNNHSAILHTLAIQQSYDMAERIRANRAASLSGAYDDLNSSTVTCISDVTSCSSIASFDFAQWYNTTQDVLPSGDGKVVGQAVDNNGDGNNDSQLFTITVNWVEQSNPNATVSLEIQP